MKYRCPRCTVAARNSDKTKKEGVFAVRTIIYECGTLLKITQDGFRFTSEIIESKKCLEVVRVFK